MKSKMVGKLSLIFRQHVDAEVLGGTKMLDDGNRVAEADQNQRRFERYGCERADGQAVGYTGFVHNSSDSDAGSKAAAGMAEGLRRDRRHPAFDTFA